MIKANREHKKLVIGLLAQAFQSNQSVQYILPQDKKKEQRIKKLMSYSFEVCYQFGDVFLSDDQKACALVLYPDKKKTSLHSILWDINFALSCVGISGIKRVMEREAKIKGFHPEEPFSYLWFIGVDTEFQHRGIGTALLQELIDYSQHQNRVIYLETSTLKNVPWYQKNGFDVFQELDFTYKLFMLRQQ